MADIDSITVRLEGAPRGGQFGRRLGRAIRFGTPGLLTVMWGLFVWSAWQQFTVSHATAVSNTATLAKLVDAWALSTLERVNYLAAAIEIQLERGLEGAALEDLLRRQQMADPNLFRVIDIIDRNGRRIATSERGHRTDRTRNFDSDSASVSPSLIGLPREVAGRTLIPVLRPLAPHLAARAYGVVVEVDGDYFGGFSGDLGLPKDASVVLMRTDGPLLARNRNALGKVGQSYPESALWKARDRLRAGALEAIEMDGVKRVVSFRTSAVYPLVVSIGFPTSGVYAEAWRRTISSGALGLVLSIVLMLAARMMLFEVRLRAAAEAAAAIAVAAVESVGSGVAVVEIGGEHRVDLANPAFGRLLRLGGRSPVGAAFGDLAGPEAQALLEQCALAASDMPEVTEEIRLPRRNGEALWVELRIAPIADRAGLQRHAVVVMTDVSERRRTADELLRAKDRAEEASRAKSEFLANMSHELRTPLNAVIGFSDIIASQLFGPVGNGRYREYAELIRTSGGHLLEVISDILDLAKIEADRVVLDEKPVAVPDVLAMCATLVASRAAEAEVLVNVSAAAGLPALQADELRVKQIVINLLSNAVKFSPAGSEVRVAAALDADGCIVIEVRDCGCGMTEEEVALAIQPFRQVNSAIAKREEGTGLGLPLALRLAALHGGRLVIDSAPGIGTTATVRFPRARTLVERAVA